MPWITSREAHPAEGQPARHGFGVELQFAGQNAVRGEMSAGALASRGRHACPTRWITISVTPSKAIAGAASVSATRSASFGTFRSIHILLVAAAAIASSSLPQNVEKARR